MALSCLQVYNSRGRCGLAPFHMLFSFASPQVVAKVTDRQRCVLAMHVSAANCDRASPAPSALPGRDTKFTSEPCFIHATVEKIVLAKLQETCYLRSWLLFTSHFVGAACLCVYMPCFMHVGKMSSAIPNLYFLKQTLNKPELSSLARLTG